MFKKKKEKKKKSSAEAVCVSKMELSLISFSPSPSLICASVYLDSDGSARRGGDSSPLINWKVWESQEVQFFQKNTLQSTRIHSWPGGGAQICLITAPWTRSCGPPLWDRDPRRLWQIPAETCHNSLGKCGFPLFTCRFCPSLTVWWRISFPHQQIWKTNK